MKTLALHVEHSRRRLVVATARIRGLDADWVSVGVVAASAIVLILLFRPWLVAYGNDGTIDVNAFGTSNISYSRINIWSTAPPHAAVSGVWGILASIAGAVTIITVLINLRVRTRTLGAVAAGSSVATALCVVACILYINSKNGELRAMVTPQYNQIGTQVGLILRELMGNGNYPAPGARRGSWKSAGLTAPALTAGFLSLMAAISAVTQWFIKYTNRTIRLPRRHSPITNTTV